MLRCSCCHRWTVEEILLDGRPVLRVLFAGGAPRYCRTVHEVRAHIGETAYLSLEPEPVDGCE